jgi:hypothetical protein
VLEVKEVSLHAFRVALRWAMQKGYPNNIKQWTQEQSDTIQAVANEANRRANKRWENRNA